MNPEDTDETQARREFLKRVGSAVIVAPAVTLLLLARSRKALAGSGGNWDPNQTLNGGRVEWPKGSLIGFVPSDNLRHLEAWVVQDTTGATQRTEQTGNWNLQSWTAKDGRWTEGTFQPGPAKGWAVVSWKDGTGAFKNYAWSQSITLI